MPENLASVLTELVDESSSRARPLPVASVAARGRTRQRRQRATALASSVVVCAVAAGAGVSISGTSSDTGPTGRVTPPPITKSSIPNRVFPSAGSGMFLAGSELPASDSFKWALSPEPGPTDDKLPFPVCGTGGAAGPVTSVHAEKTQTHQYWSPNTSSDGSETIYEYPSAAAARSDYTSLVPDPARCAQHPLPGAEADSAAGHQTAAITDGYAWVQTGSIPGGPVQGRTQHVMVTLAGNKIAFFAYTETDTGTTKYDTAGDAQALQLMATRLDHPSSVPGPAVAPPPPDSAFLNAAQVAFPPDVDAGKGWVELPVLPVSAGQAAPTALCGGDLTNFVGGVDSIGVTHAFTARVGATGEAVANAGETIHAYPNAAAAAAGFRQAQKIAATSGCHTAINGSTYDYSVVAGATTSDGFSIQIINGPDETTHEYIVVKGTNVAQLNIQYFNHYSSGTSSTDQQVLATLAAALP
ncbi:MAG: hypothetical protein HOV87_03635 [Catenulispora sp.]|nr:hypothetical protein [Catenulispora sp.]